MAQMDTVSCEPVTVLFCCRPRSLRDYFQLRYQGMLPSPKWLRFLDPIIPVVSPVLETFILACLPAVLAGFLLGVLVRYNPPLFWMRVVFAGILAASVPLAVWWFWISPRNDRIEVHSTGFRWRISLARVEWFRCAGSVEFGDLKGFAYRTDCFERAPLESGRALGHQLARLWLEGELSRHELFLYLKSGKRPVEMTNVFARFEEEDLQRLLDHLARVAETCCIDVGALNLKRTGVRHQTLPS